MARRPGRKARLVVRVEVVEDIIVIIHRMIIEALVRIPPLGSGVASQDQWKHALHFGEHFRRWPRSTGVAAIGGEVVHTDQIGETFLIWLVAKCGIINDGLTRHDKKQIESEVFQKPINIVAGLGSNPLASE